VAPRDEIIPAADLAARLAALDGWHGATTGISKTYTISYDAAIQAVGEIGQAAIELEHRPDIDIRWDRLTVYLTTHTAGDVVTELDFLLAERIDQITVAHGATTATNQKLGFAGSPSLSVDAPDGGIGNSGNAYFPAAGYPAAIASAAAQN
jgi:4a-hydroxytetrahydrobiopterin dehydratase